MQLLKSMLGLLGLGLFVVTVAMTATSSPSNGNAPFATKPLPPLPDFASVADLRSTHVFSRTAHWIVPGLLMQGARPSPGPNLDDVVRRAGCRTFACLQAERAPEEGATLLGDGGTRDWEEDGGAATDILPSYSREVRAIAAEAGGGGGRPPAFLHYGIRDMETAKSVEGLADVASTLADRIRAGETVYLHCWGGKGRAGLVGCCLLMELYGIDASSALEIVRTLCRLRDVDGDLGVPCESPETEDQKEQVREYHRRIRRKAD
ncbi:hypothetical protein ACHAWF_014633 [Thalassiosira exigua]